MSIDIPTTDILGVKINALTMPLTIETIERWIETGEKHYVCICTVHSIMAAQDDPAYMEVLNNAGLRTPDGMPLVWLSKRAGQLGVKRVAGPDLLPAMLERGTETGHSHYFFGGGPNVAEDLVRTFSRKYPRLNVAGFFAPGARSTGELEPKSVIDTINASNPDVIWVGLGSPKQDFWAAQHLSQVDASVVIAVGAAFDFHSGRVDRAPKWMQERGLEWIHRLSSDPRRLWSRYLIGNSRFFWKLINR